MNDEPDEDFVTKVCSSIKPQEGLRGGMEGVDMELQLALLASMQRMPSSQTTIDEFGLRNLENTCFLNVVFQSMAHNPKIMKYIPRRSEGS